MSKDTIYRQDAIDALDCISGVEEVLRSLPTAQPEPCEDCVSRQDAIEVAKAHWYKPDIAGALAELPSAQPEIIRCGQCKYAEVADPEDDQDGYTCQFHRGSIWFSGSYCSWAERREE